jgi:hypothetical protein
MDINTKEEQKATVPGFTAQASLDQAVGQYRGAPHAALPQTGLQLAALNPLVGLHLPYCKFGWYKVCPDNFDCIFICADWLF